MLLRLAKSLSYKFVENLFLCYNEKLSEPLVHSAHYDSNGNIILEEDSYPVMKQEGVQQKSPEPLGRESRKTGWTVVSDMPKTEANISAVQAVRDTCCDKEKKSIANESIAQFQTTAADVLAELHELRTFCISMPKRMRCALKAFWKNANAPLHLPAFMKPGKRPPTKLKLFIVDTVRFGGTFAGIFVVLFVMINYQSFFQIAKAQLALGDDLKTEQALEHMVSRNQEGSSTESNSSTNLLSYLPTVGPYEDRLIIPKLGENVPIVRPSMDSLMNEDWKKFEDDIQEALHDGVVHYPGSAKPGQAGNFFLTGHSSYYPWDSGKYKNVFARLKDLEPGDVYSVYYGGDRHTYRVTSKREVKPNDVSVLDQPTDKRIATLMTCTPIGTTLKRLIILAEEIDPATGEKLTVGEKVTEEQIAPRARLESLPI